MPNEDFPLRVDGVTAGWAAERRPEDVIPAARTDAWQLVYVRSGTIEERCDDRRVLLRAGGLLFHQPAETFGMRPVGEVPPDVLRLDFLCTQAGMDRFRGAVFHAEPQEQHDLNWLMDAVTEYFEPPDTLGQATVPKEEQPYGAQQQLTIRRGGRAHGLPQRGLLQPKIQGGHRQHPQRLPPPAAGFAGPPPKQATKRQRRIENLYCRNTAKKVK